MPYQATVYRILIASPSDVTSERKAIPDVIGAWNATHSEDYSVVLLPVMWETHSTPEMGDRPQAILNKQLVASCDLLVGAFWTRIGTHTGVSESGTIEEIEEIRKAGKPVLLYFSSQPVVLDSIDTEQYECLKNFKEKCQKEGLVEKYDSISELREKLIRHLTHVVKEIHGEPSFQTTQVDESLHSLNSMKGQLQSLITRTAFDWSTEKNSEPMNIDEGKYILKNLASDLIDMRAYLEGLDQSALKNLEAQISKIKKLQEHHLFLDGGKSYRNFWKTGDEILESLRQIVVDLKYPSQAIQPGIEEGKIKILKVLAKAEENRNDPLEDINISRETELSMSIARYYLGELEKEDYIHTSYAIGQPPLYRIKQKGREFLISNKLI